MLGQCIGSRILEQRGLEPIRTDMAEVARLSMSKELCHGDAFDPSDPKSFPKDFSKILKPGKSWPSATVRAFFDGMISWGLVENWDVTDQDILRGSWWTRLLVP